jgi:hypothetical protein
MGFVPKKATGFAPGKATGLIVLTGAVPVEPCVEPRTGSAICACKTIDRMMASITGSPPS